MNNTSPKRTCYEYIRVTLRRNHREHLLHWWQHMFCRFFEAYRTLIYVFGKVSCQERSMPFVFFFMYFFGTMQAERSKKKQVFAFRGHNESYCYIRTLNNVAVNLRYARPSTSNFTSTQFNLAMMQKQVKCPVA